MSDSSKTENAERKRGTAGCSTLFRERMGAEIDSCARMRIVSCWRFVAPNRRGLTADSVNVKPPYA